MLDLDALALLDRALPVARLPVPPAAPVRAETATCPGTGVRAGRCPFFHAQSDGGSA